MKKILLFALVLISYKVQAQVQIQTPMPAQTSTFSTNARGYWFVSPTCFTLTGAEVPLDASSGNQSIAIVRFQTIPPTYSTTTNSFDILFLTQNNPASGIIPCNVYINQGDIIGVMGVRSNINSYSNAGNTTTIDGFSVNLTRLGMQFPLATTPPQELWTEPSSSNISRCFLYYDTSMVYNINYSNIGPSFTFDDGNDTLYTNAFTIWNYGDGSPLDTNYNPTHVYTSNGNYNVCAYIHSGCFIDTVCTTVNVCDYLAVAGFSSSLAGSTLTFTDTSNYATSWYWNFGDGDTSTLQNPVHSYATVGWYYVTQIVSNSCGISDTLQDSILVCTTPTAAMNVTDANEDSVSFSNASNYGTSWLWDFGDGDSSVLENPYHTYANNGSYNVCLIASNLCGSDTTCTIITACPTDPNPGFSYTNNVFNANFSNSSTFITSSSWDFGDGNSSSALNPLHTYTAAGTYWVCLTGYDECGDSAVFCDSVTIAGNIGIENIVEDFTIRLYPNPTNGISNLYIDSDINGKYEVKITDITGKVITTPNLDGNKNYTIDASTWRKGIYLVIIESGKNKKTVKLIVR